MYFTSKNTAQTLPCGCSLCGVVVPEISFICSNLTLNDAGTACCYSVLGLYASDAPPCSFVLFSFHRACDFKPNGKEDCSKMRFLEYV